MVCPLSSFVPFLSLRSTHTYAHNIPHDFPFPAARGHACQKCCSRFIQPQAARSSLRPGPPVASALASVITYKGALPESAETGHPGMQLSPIQVYQEVTPDPVRSAMSPTPGWGGGRALPPSSLHTDSLPSPFHTVCDRGPHPEEPRCWVGLGS